MALDHERCGSPQLLERKTGSLEACVRVLAGDAVAITPVAEDLLDRFMALPERVVVRRQSANREEQSPVLLAGDRLRPLALWRVPKQALESESWLVARVQVEAQARGLVLCGSSLHRVRIPIHRGAPQ
jgi:hypothetical protein